MFFAARGLLLVMSLGMAFVVGCAKEDDNNVNAAAPFGRRRPPENPPANPPAEKKADTKTAPTTPSAQNPSVQKTANANSPESSSPNPISPKVIEPKKVEAAPSQPKTYDPLFVEWPKPLLALVITGRQNGYIEPCGCTGLANQKGGMSRRMTLAAQLKTQGWPLLALDAGNQIKRIGRQSEIKFQIAFEGLKKMDYRAVGFGPDDLRLSSGELLAALSDSPNRFVSANTAVLDPDLTPKFQVFTVGGKKIGVTAVLGDESQKKISSDEVILAPAAKTLGAVIPKLEAQNCDLNVLLAHATLEESRALAKQFPQFKIVITSGGAEEPAYEPEIVADTRTRLIQVGAKGMYVGVLGIFDDAKKPFRYQRVPLDDRFDDSPEMLALLSAYQDQLKNAGLEGLGLRPVPHPSNNLFVGSAKCGECHTQAFKVWKESKHAHATESLVHPVERKDIARHFDPECLSCHVTGWDPQKLIPFTSGYLGLKETPLMHANGCENCHGPGSAHVAAEEGKAKVDANKLTQLRGAMRLPLAQAERKCMECHDLDNSPAFHRTGAFEKYWKEIAHPGKD